MHSLGTEIGSAPRIKTEAVLGNTCAAQKSVGRDPGTHTPIIVRRLCDCAQALLRQKVYKQHKTTYASDLIEFDHCGLPFTGERKTKMTKSGEREYMYYRCTQYHKGDHPRIRLTEKELDRQMLVLFDTLRVEDDEFREELPKTTNWDQDSDMSKAAKFQEELAFVRQQQKQLLNLRMLEEIDADAFASTSRDLRDKEAELKLEIDVSDKGRHEIIDTAVKAFELSQSLREKWFDADYAAKRRILEIIGLNWTLDDVSHVPEWRKPFDLLAKGLVSKEQSGRLDLNQRPLRPERDLSGCISAQSDCVCAYHTTAYDDSQAYAFSANEGKKWRYNALKRYKNGTESGGQLA